MYMEIRELLILKKETDGINVFKLHTFPANHTNLNSKVDFLELILEQV